MFLDRTFQGRLNTPRDESVVQPLPQPGPVMRLTFAYEGDKITLLSEQEVTTVAAPSHPLEDLESTAGFSIVLRDARGNPQILL